MYSPPTGARGALGGRGLESQRGVLTTVSESGPERAREGADQSRPSGPEVSDRLEGIDHRTTQIRSPQTNGFVERMNRTLLDECFRIDGRTTWYAEPEEIQRDLDRFPRYYNLDRSHQGYRLRGRTPVQALREARGIDEIPPVVPEEESLEAA